MYGHSYRKMWPQHLSLIESSKITTFPLELFAPDLYDFYFHEQEAKNVQHYLIESIAISIQAIISSSDRLVLFLQLGVATSLFTHLADVGGWHR